MEGVERASRVSGFPQAVYAHMRGLIISAVGGGTDYHIFLVHRGLTLPLGIERCLPFGKVAHNVNKVRPLPSSGPLTSKSEMDECLFRSS